VRSAASAVVRSGEKRKDFQISWRINLLHLVHSAWTVGLFLRYARILIVTTSILNRD
jgi:hypothetical protein